MTVFVYHTPQVASPSETRRAGTYRISSNNSDPIRFTRGWDTVLYFAFRDHTQRPYFMTGRTVTARLYNTENVEVWNGTMTPDALVDGAASLVIGKAQTETLQPGLYSMVVEYQDDYNRTLVAYTSHSLNRFVVEVLNQTTVDLNN